MFLGVDGGGTKTAFAIINAQGDLLASHQEPTCYHVEVGIEGAKAVINRGISAVLSKAGKTVDELEYGFLGLPAFGEDSEIDPSLATLPSDILPQQNYQCDNDMVNAWAAAFAGEDGINMIAGTGSIAYGMRAGKSARCGGWGELFSDEGSAYWIGRKGLMLFSRMSDGRDSKGPLYYKLKDTFEITNDLDMSALVLTKWQGSRGRIAQISTLVYEAAVAGDTLAKKIFSDAGEELAEIVEGTRKALQYSKDEEVKVSFSGGAFSANDFITKPFANALQEFSSTYRIQQPAFSPVIGAAIYAAKLSGEALSASALKRLQGV
ncbi:BadF/BadG/BcrA/BcrD ATPase family protein [Aliiglaciecola sp. 3_MG-2023]|uniref:N-acetylglucosamine kinase n=1 Tax=Aliiglaciecola sp. 3_MG-2023 TaxID=3062644 RepID=UPI0026E1F7B2|nr:BadF/BadG/BcrA/BcrD ATPase family protein [Aliiglaciecola sp. 3_MG-2023]MDO6694557.1 BadF/BadG/BcrA/BcrD ATPase family protein [Aliiglaciecola sp. 3_MG-2023]